MLVRGHSAQNSPNCISCIFRILIVSVKKHCNIVWVWCNLTKEKAKAQMSPILSDFFPLTLMGLGFYPRKIRQLMVMSSVKWL